MTASSDTQAGGLSKRLVRAARLESGNSGHWRDLCLEAADELTRLRASHAALVEALKHADGFITNGIELGYIRMPDPGTPDTAHETPRIVRAALKQAGEV